MTNDKLQAMKNKIKHLLNRTVENGASEAEAETSMNLAYKLMIEYNLSKSEVENHNTDKTAITRQTFMSSSNQRFHRTIYGATAELYFCDYYYTAVQGCGTRHTIVGEEHNIEIAKQMAEYFISIGEELAKQHKGMGRDFITSFKKGFGNRMYHRLMDRKKEAMTQTATNAAGTALVLADAYVKTEKQIKLYYQSENIKLRSASSNIISNRDGYFEGQAAANGVGLNRPVGSSSHKALI